MKRMTTGARWCWALALLAVVGCGPEQFSSKKATPEATKAGVSEETEAGTAFHALTLDQALEKAKTDGKVVMVDFYTVWCGPCKLLDQKTWTDDKVKEWLREKTVAVKFDAEKEEVLAEKYRIESYPTLLFVNPDGSELGRISSFVKPNDFLKRADQILAGN